MDETWRSIAGFEGLYEVSDRGRVKSLCDKRGIRIRKLVPDKYGYLTVSLKKNGKYYCFKVHRLVAMAFIPNPLNHPQVNHMDENKKNNDASNLEWCTARYNNLYMDKYKCSNIPVRSLDESGAAHTYESIRMAAKETGTNETCISMVLHGRRKKAGGYKWEYLF